MKFVTRALAAPAVLAAASLAALPAEAAQLPTSSHVEASPTAHGWGGPYVSTGISWGSSWGSGWGGWGGGYRRHRDTTAGDILTGVIILGTIAAVASAASKANQNRPYRYPDQRPYPDNRRYDDRRTDNRTDGPQGLQGAADLCLRAVERNARAREVTRVERDGAGWQVFGTMADGAPFNCAIGNDGRVNRVDVGGRAVSGADAAPARQDDSYRSASAAGGAEPRPEYPGGPLPGDNPDARPVAPAPQG